MKVVLIVGARPNFVKAAPILRELRARQHDVLLVHTGQHHDTELYRDMFRDLELKDPDVNLLIGSVGRPRFTMEAVLGLRAILRDQKPSWVIVVGDVDSTLAGALAAAKEGVALAHVEAGLRSRDHRMVEEFNRQQVDALSDLLFCTTDSAVENLRLEKVPGRSHRVGNTMIDTLVWAQEKISERASRISGDFGVVTLHRPELVDHPELLKAALETLNGVARQIPLRFPVHPRTKLRIGTQLDSRIEAVPPLAYLDFIALVLKAKFVVTDSGGLQEETTFLGIPCLTVRDSTERPETILEGTNRLIAMENLSGAVEEILNQPRLRRGNIELWDGRAAERIVSILAA